MNYNERGLIPPEDPYKPYSPGEFGQYSTLSPEPIEVIEAWRLEHHTACALKYIARWKRKGGLEDLRKARWYLDRYIGLLEREMKG